MNSQPLTSSCPAITVCICTFRRPAWLQTLLQALWDQTYPAAQVHVCVIDNDPAASAQAVLMNAEQQWAGRLSWQHVPQANISLARNGAIHLAQTEWVALIDDDEQPEPDWLYQLWQTQVHTQAQAVLAPVVPRYAAHIPGWIQRGGYFERPRFASGTLVPLGETRSGNVLLHRPSLLALCQPLVANASLLEQAQTGPFDLHFGRTGGEDSWLFRQLLARGARVVWCDTAPVYEWVPLERANARWLLQRAYRLGQLFMRSELAARQGWPRLRCLLYLSTRAVLQGALALVLALCYLPIRVHRAFAWLRTAAAQAGKLSALFGFQQKAYGQS
ncbi:glycosyltransferase [Parvibium lacunae]|uniref:Glycosyltransferase n=1 Tax=Parvibium lacunae TaxID=1888893 RepID=A0A368L1S4_9BURK|nr:glycosyltransferase family 2 protein [Parvibium lacunae]RCS57062.1 glycosyltransferase [Parvibium lacunae]